MKTRRILMSLIGVVICGISVGIFKIAAMGVGPFQTLMSGLDKLIPISFGTLYIITNMVLLTFSLVTDRHNIGLATFINLFLLGCGLYLPASGSIGQIPTVAGVGTIVTAFLWAR